MRRMLAISAVFAAAAAHAAPGDPAGVAAAVRGDVTLVAYDAAPDAVGVDVASGQGIALGDRIATGPESGMQVMLLDQTVFTIGPQARMTVDAFVFDPDSGAGTVAASIAKGAFRFVSGRVAKDDPANMSVRVPGATIGVRGTTVMGTTDGTATTVALVGAGPDNNAGERPGRIIVSSGGVSREIFRPGFFVTIEGPDLPPSAPAPMPPGMAAGIAGQLDKQAPAKSAESGSDGGAQSASAPLDSGPSVTEQSGQSTAAAEPGTRQAEAQIEQVEATENAAEAAAQSNEAITEVATFDQLRSVNTGVVNAAVTGVPLTATQGTGNGSYDFQGTIDFGARTVAMQGTITYSLGGSPAQNETISDSHNYTNDPSIAANVFESNGHDASAFGCHPGCTEVFKVGVAILNDTGAGEIASDLATKVKVSDGTNTIEGEATTPFN